MDRKSLVTLLGCKRRSIVFLGEEGGGRVRYLKLLICKCGVGKNVSGYGEA